LTANTRLGNNNGDNINNVSTASLPPGDAFTHNSGLSFPPISQYDSDQYSDFKLPAYANNASEATVLTIIARAIARTEAAKYMIDGFWNGVGETWPGAGRGVSSAVVWTIPAACDSRVHARRPLPAPSSAYQACLLRSA